MMSGSLLCLMTTRMLMVLVVGLLAARTEGSQHDNFCVPLEDWGPRADQYEDRVICRTSLVKECEEREVNMCMNVTELRCEVELFADCNKLDWRFVEGQDYFTNYSIVMLKTCEKTMVADTHNKTVYECRNVTKQHCTTLWKVNDAGEKIWAGNEDDCREVTWEECEPVIKTVKMMVPYVNCTEEPHIYLDYFNTTVDLMADTMDCTVDKRAVCEPVTLQKCDDLTFTTCTDVPQTNCTNKEVIVPTQPKIHKKWCLFDQKDDIDFDSEVRELTRSPRTPNNFPFEEIEADKKDNTATNVAARVKVL